MTRAIKKVEKFARKAKNQKAVVSERMAAAQWVYANVTIDNPNLKWEDAVKVVAAKLQ